MLTYHAIMTSPRSGHDPDSTFDALGDRTRRELLVLLRHRERSVSELAEPFPHTRSAISQHLGVLLQAGLVERRREGRRQLYSLSAQPLAAIYDWVGVFEEFWDDRLERLGDYLEDQHG